MKTTQFEVGQPVWVTVHFTGNKSPEWIDGVIVDNSGKNDVYLIRYGRKAGFIIKARSLLEDDYVQIVERPTTMWTVRQWVRSLMK